MGIIFCCGMPRSASTWSFNVCRHLLQHAYPGSAIWSSYSDDFSCSQFEESARPEQIVVKSHHPNAEMLEMLKQGSATCVYTHRDPIDAVVSLINMFHLPFERAVDEISLSLRLFDADLDGRVCAIPYQSVMAAPIEMIKEIAKWCGVDVTEDQLAVVDRATTMAAMAALSEHVGEIPEETVELGQLRWDRQTLLHQKHIRNGASGYGRTSLAPEQVEAVVARFGNSKLAQKYFAQ